MQAGLFASIATLILLLRFPSYYYLSTELLRKVFVPLKGREAQSGPLLRILGCHLCLLKPKNGAKEK